MKQFLKTILIYTLIVVTITVSVNAVYMQAHPESETEKFKYVPYDIQISNFGSSHGKYAFNYIDEGNNVCFNFAINSQYPSYDLRVMKNYIDHLESGGIVFLPISYFSLFGSIQTERSNFLSKNTRYYHFLPKELIIEYNPTTMFFEHFPVLTTDGISLFKSFFPDPVDAPVDNGSYAETSPTAAAEHAQGRYQAHVKDHLDKDGNSIYNQEEIAAIYEMIQLCKDHNIEAVLITTPYLSEYSSEVKKNNPIFIQNFYGVIEEIQANTGVRYYDYSTDERFSSRYDLFIDSDHLNQEGARQFTNILIQETLGK